MKNIVFITERELLTDYPELYDELCIEQEDIENGYIPDFWIDCEKVKGGLKFETSQFASDFRVNKQKDVTYIFSPFELEQSEKDVITWFLNGCKDAKENNNSWQDWNDTFKGVAYRGGSGYAYTIYTKEFLTENSEFNLINQK